MANNLDARPFVDLQKDAKEFQEKFTEDVENLMKFLDSKLTALILDPDSLGGSSSSAIVKSASAIDEFSRAKFDIFNQVKSVVNQMEREWLQYISEMKKLFIENVEIFLAGTKLEVKVEVPSNEFQTSPIIGSPFIPKGSPSKSKLSVVVRAELRKRPAERELPARAKASKEEPDDLLITDSEMETVKVSKRSLTPKSRSSDRSSLSSLSGNDSSKESKTRRIKMQKQSSRSNSTVPTLSPINDVQKNGTSAESGRDLGSELKSLPKRGRARKGAEQLTDVPKKISSSEENEELPGPIESSVSRMPSTRGRKTPAKITKAVSEVAAKTPRGRSKKSVSQDTASVVSVTATKTPKQSAKTVSQDVVLDPALLSKTPRSSRKPKKATPAASVSGSSGVDSASQESENEPVPEAVKSAAKRKGRSAKVKSQICIDSDDVGTMGDETYIVSSTSGAKLGVGPPRGSSKSPKKVTFNQAQDAEDEGMFHAAAKPRRPPTPGRRKTLMPRMDAVVSDDDLAPSTSRALGKRKTIASVADLSVSLPSKKMKAGRKSTSASQAEECSANLFESDGNYSFWLPLGSVDSKIPAKPGIYEVKVLRAKKTAYIGCTENLQTRLDVHKKLLPSGHKHLDKFIERNLTEIQVRYECVDRLADAKEEHDKRLTAFVDLYKTTPAYN